MLNWNMIGAMFLPNAGGWAGAFTMSGQVKNEKGLAWYQSIKKPRWNPPNWVFGPAWTGLYCSMGYASYMIYNDCGGFTDKAAVPLGLYGGHLLLNWAWTPIFFKYHKIGWALAEVLALDVAAVATTVSFYQINNSTIYFMAPYLGWLAFATCLNHAIWKLNKNTIEPNTGRKEDRYEK